MVSNNQCDGRCSLGRYGASTGLTADADCSECAIGTFTESIGSVNCKSCALGLYPNPDVAALAKCVACDAGKYGQGDGDALTEAAGCATCDAGTYQPSSGQALCALCARGKFVTGTPSAAAVVCADCPVGKFSSAGAGFCDECSSGTYNDEPKQYVCKNCAVNTYRVAVMGDLAIASTDCTDCPANTYSPPGSTVPASCDANAVPRMAVTSIATDCGASCALVSGGVLTLSGSLLESSMTITVGGSPCVPVSVASNAASATCPLPVGTGGDAQVLVSSHPLEEGIADQVTYDCPARTKSMANGKCVFEDEVRKEPLGFNNVCPDASTAGSIGCNNDIVQPNGTDDDYNETLIAFLIPVGGVAGFVAALVIMAVTILYFTKSPYLKHLRQFDRFGGLHGVNENAAVRFTKTPLGGFVSLLFGSAFLSLQSTRSRATSKTTKLCSKFPRR